MSRMAANTLFNERIQTRVVQAIGRCTRSLEDYSAVVVTGDDLPDYLADIRRRKFFHPELQAEIDFGVRQSKDTDAANILENFDLKGAGFQSARSIHLQAEAKRLAYEDRARYYADPHFAKVPVEWLISKEYAAERRKLAGLKSRKIQLQRQMESDPACRPFGGT